MHCLQTHRKCLSYSSLLFYSTIYTQPHDACIMHQCSKHNMPDLFGIRAAHPKLLSGLWLTLHATWWFTRCIIVIWISKQLSKLEHIQTYNKLQVNKCTSKVSTTAAIKSGKVGDRVCTQHRRPIVDTVLLCRKTCIHICYIYI